MNNSKQILVLNLILRGATEYAQVLPEQNIRVFVGKVDLCKISNSINFIKSISPK